MIFAHVGDPHDTDGMQEMMRNMMGESSPMSGGMMVMGLLWLVIGLLLLAVFTLALIALLKYLRRGTEDAVLEALKRRYAEGKISREEFSKIKKELKDKK